MAAGETTVSRLLDEEESDVGTASFVRRVAALGLIRTVERSIEGCHARITAILRKSPNASSAHISLCLRFKHLAEQVADDPQVGCRNWANLVLHDQLGCVIGSAAAAATL